MDKEDTELLVDKKIAEAKLIIAEKRLTFVLTIAAAIITIFGVMLPLLLTFHSETRVDTAISKMEQGYKELAGKQLRKPKLQCYIEGRVLANAVISIDPSKPYIAIEIKNIGDGTADFTKVRIYVDADDADILNIVFRSFWYSIVVANDKPVFKHVFEYPYDRGFKLLPVQDSTFVSITLPLVIPNPTNQLKPVKFSALLRIFYGEPIPMDVPFTIDAQITIAKPIGE